MTFSVIHLRIAVIVVNLALAGGLAYFYVDGHVNGGDEDPFKSMKVVTVSKFDPKVGDVKKTPPATHYRTATSSAMALVPRKPLPKIDKQDEPEKVEDVEETEEAKEGGPLDEDWEYVWCINDQDEPLDTLVMLRKKDKAPARRTSSSRVTRSRTVRRTPSRSSRTSASSGDTLFFRVRDRRYRDDDADLDFFLVSCNLEEFVYGIQEQKGRPLKLYALERQSPTHFGGQEPVKSILKLEEPKEEEEEDEEEEEKLIKIVPQDVQDLREKEFQSLLTSGKAPRESHLVGTRNRSASSRGSSSSPRVNRARPVPSTKTTPDKSKTDTSATKKTTSGPITDPKKKAEAVKELKEGIKNIPKDAQDKILNELKKPQ